jgi:FtsH-binding integral membrane protein
MEYVVYRSATEINSAMGRVYGNMSIAVIISMFVSYLVGSSQELVQFFFTGIMQWIVFLAPLVAIFAISFAMQKVDKQGARLMLYGFSALMGLCFAMIFQVYQLGSIVNAFMGATVLFGTLSAYGYFTKKDLTSIGQFCFIGLIAIIIASIINVIMAAFWPGTIDNSLFGQVISALAIIIFLGLTAYDTQKIREEVSYETNGVAEVRGALTLYMDFINIFLNLLNLFGDRK